MSILPFPPYEPDKSDLNAQVSADIRNVVPIIGGYGPVKGLEPFSEPFPDDEILGKFKALDVDGTPYHFAASANKIYLLSALDFDWDDVTRALGGYAATPEAPWSATQRGRQVFFTNQNDDLQVFNLGSSTLFEDCPGNPPRAGIVKNWGVVLALMDLTSDPEQVHWSEINNTEGWTPGTNGSDFNDFPGGGRVLSSTESTNPIIWQKRDIHQGTFIPGSDVIYTFTKIQEKRGAMASKSIASRGDTAIYVDEGEFNLISGAGLSYIGREKVNRTIFGTMSTINIEEIEGLIDPFQDRAYYAADYGGVGYYDTIFVYDISLQQWSVIKVDILGLLPISTLGVTLDNLDDFYPPPDSMTISLDDRILQGGTTIFAVFDLEKRLCTFSGPNMQAYLCAAEMGNLDNTRTQVDSVRGIVETEDYTISIASRFKLSSAFQFTQEVAPTAQTGRCDIRVESNFHRVRMTINAGAVWQHAQGVDVNAYKGGFL